MEETLKKIEFKNGNFNDILEKISSQRFIGYQPELWLQKTIITKLQYKLEKTEEARNQWKRHFDYSVLQVRKYKLQTDAMFEIVAHFITKNELDEKAKTILFKHYQKEIAKAQRETQYARAQCVSVFRGHYPIQFRVSWFFRKFWQWGRRFRDWLQAKLKTKQLFNQELKKLREEIKTIQEAFEFLLADWIEDMIKKGVPEEKIVAERRVFEKVMYWKKPEKKKKLIYSESEIKKAPPSIDLDAIMKKGEI